MFTHLLNRRAASSLTPSRSRPQTHRSTGRARKAVLPHIACQSEQSRPAQATPRPCACALCVKKQTQRTHRRSTAAVRSAKKTAALCRAQPAIVSHRLAFLTVERPQKLRQVAALQGAAPRPTRASHRLALRVIKHCVMRLVLTEPSPHSLCSLPCSIDAQRVVSRRAAAGRRRTAQLAGRARLYCTTTPANPNSRGLRRRRHGPVRAPSALKKT